MKGTAFNLKEDLGDWFDFFESSIDIKTGKITYDDPIPETGKARFRSSAQFVRDKIAKRAKESEYVLNTASRAMERNTYYKDMTPEEEQKERDDAIDHSITGLKDFYDMEGNPIECTRENKLLLILAPVFDRFMARCLELQLNAKTARVKVAEKNSKTP